MDVDESVGDRLGLWSSRLLATYVGMDERAGELCRFVKAWARRRGLTQARSEHNLSSYAWTLLCIFHLQASRVLPVLQQLPTGVVLF